MCSFYLTKEIEYKDFSFYTYILLIVCDFLYIYKQANLATLYMQ